MCCIKTLIWSCLKSPSQGRLDFFEAQRQNCKMRPSVSMIEASRRGRKQRNLGKLNLEAFLEPCWLLLGGSLNASKEAVNRNFDISWWGLLETEALGQTAPSAPPSRQPCSQLELLGAFLDGAYSRVWTKYLKMVVIQSCHTNSWFLVLFLVLNSLQFLLSVLERNSWSDILRVHLSGFLYLLQEKIFWKAPIVLGKFQYKN